MREFYFTAVFSILISLSFLSCQKKSEDPIPSNDLDFGVYYFKAKIGENYKDFLVGEGMSSYYAYIGCDIENGSEENCSRFTFESSLINDLSDESFELSIGSLKKTEEGYPNNESFFNFFRNFHQQVGSSSFFPVHISYYDIYGNLWRSDGNQSKSSFSIVKLEERVFFNTAMVILQADFNCILYSENGESMPLKNGSCKLSFENI